MSFKWLLVLSTVVSAFAISVTAAPARRPAEQHQQGPTGTFLTPLPRDFVISPGDRRYPRELCRQPSMRPCVPVLFYGGVVDHGLPVADPPLTSRLPHVRVMFVLEEIYNDYEFDGGATIGVENATVLFSTTSTAASVENGSYEMVGLPLPNHGVNLSAVIYDALVLNACESFSFFPVEHETELISGDPNSFNPGATFHGVDHSTVDSTGYYNFRYSIQVVQVGFSTFYFSGKVSATCTGLTSLP